MAWDRLSKYRTRWHGDNQDGKWHVWWTTTPRTKGHTEMLDEHTVTLTTREVELILTALEVAEEESAISEGDTRPLARKLTQQTGVQ